jgi:pyruvate,water dikinase
MNKIIVNEQNATTLSEQELGGKAWNLAWLSSNNFPVPAWSVLTTEAFSAQLDNNDLRRCIEDNIRRIDLNDSASVARSARAIQQHFLDTPLCPAVREAIASFMASQPDTDESKNARFAVRSSVVGEDAKGASFAGQMDSCLYCRGQDEIEKAVLTVMASAFNERALIYRLNNKLPLTHIRAAVILQRMIDSDVAGVMFTANPMNGSRRQALISGTWGCGEGIVSGLCNTDEFTVPLFNDADADNNIASVINDKDRCLVMAPDAGQGTIEVAVADDKRQCPVLNTEQLLALRDLGKQIAAQRRFPQDIEWALYQGKFYILQTRPITSLPPETTIDDAALVWDNSNIQESYCGVTTPLTFSFAQRAYTTVYSQTLRLLGVNEKTLRKHQNMLDNMLALMHGRVYYNINNWYRGLLFLPSFSTNKSDLERMMGLQDPVDMIEDQTLTLKQKILRLPQMLHALVRLLSGFRKMGKLVEQFRSHFENTYATIDRDQLHTQSSGQLIRLCRELDETLLDNWTTPIINDFYVMMTNGRLHRFLSTSGIENAELVQNNLLSGEEQIESTEPTKMLLGMCDYIRQDKGLIDLFAATANDQLLPRIRAQDPTLYATCLDYIERYGDRVMGELKLESITLRQDPAFMFAVLKNFLTRDDLTRAALTDRESYLRGESEEQVFPQIKQQLGARGLRRFKRTLLRSRAAIKYRENMRLARTRTFGLYRDIYLEIGTQLAFYGVLEEARDIFWLSVDELYAWHDGRAVQAEFKPLVSARKREYDGYHANELPHHFITQDIPYLHNEYVYPHAEPQVLDGDTLKGTGCYPGIVDGTVRLIFSPEDELNLNGQILCTVRTDPGWAPLFPTASGLLVERGSTLSHSAVVARELGIPAIVGIPGLTTLLHDQQQVRMDGSSGVISWQPELNTESEDCREDNHEDSPAEKNQEIADAAC